MTEELGELHTTRDREIRDLKIEKAKLKRDLQLAQDSASNAHKNEATITRLQDRVHELEGYCDRADRCIETVKNAIESRPHRITAMIDRVDLNVPTEYQTDKTLIPQDQEEFDSRMLQGKPNQYLRNLKDTTFANKDRGPEIGRPSFISQQGHNKPVEESPVAEHGTYQLEAKIDNFQSLGRNEPLKFGLSESSIPSASPQQMTTEQQQVKDLGDFRVDLSSRTMDTAVDLHGLHPGDQSEIRGLSDHRATQQGSHSPIQGKKTGDPDQFAGSEDRSCASKSGSEIIHKEIPTQEPNENGKEVRESNVFGTSPKAARSAAAEKYLPTTATGELSFGRPFPLMVSPQTGADKRVPASVPGNRPGQQGLWDIGRKSGPFAFGRRGIPLESTAPPPPEPSVHVPRSVIVKRKSKKGYLVPNWAVNVHGLGFNTDSEEEQVENKGDDTGQPGIEGATNKDLNRATAGEETRQEALTGKQPVSSSNNIITQPPHMRPASTSQDTKNEGNKAVEETSEEILAGKKRANSSNSLTTQPPNKRVFGFTEPQS